MCAELLSCLDLKHLRRNLQIKSSLDLENHKFSQAYLHFTQGTPSVWGKRRQITFLCALCTAPTSLQQHRGLILYLECNKTPRPITKPLRPRRTSRRTKTSSGVNPVSLGLVSDPELPNVTFIVRGPVEAARRLRLWNPAWRGRNGLCAPLWPVRCVPVNAESITSSTVKRSPFTPLHPLLLSFSLNACILSARVVERRQRGETIVAFQSGRGLAVRKRERNRPLNICSGRSGEKREIGLFVGACKEPLAGVNSDAH